MKGGTLELARLLVLTQCAFKLSFWITGRVFLRLFPVYSNEPGSGFIGLFVALIIGATFTFLLALLFSPALPHFFKEP